MENSFCWRKVVQRRLPSMFCQWTPNSRRPFSKNISLAQKYSCLFMWFVEASYLNSYLSAIFWDSPNFKVVCNFNETAWYAGWIFMCLYCVTIVSLLCNDLKGWTELGEPTDTKSAARCYLVRKCSVYFSVFFNSTKFSKCYHYIPLVNLCVHGITCISDGTS